MLGVLVLIYTFDELPFDQNNLSEILRTNGETQFIILDTPAVRAIVGDLTVLQNQ